MGKLTNVSCIYTGGGIYNYSAKYNDEVWLFSDFELTGSFDRPYLHTVHYNADAPFLSDCDVLEEDPEAVEKEPSIPYPTWREVIESLRNNPDQVDGSVIDPIDIIKDYHPDLSVRMNENDDPPVKSADQVRLETIGEFIEAFEDFLDEKGIVIPNDEKDEDPDASNIYGTDYGKLSDRIEELLTKYDVL